MPFEKSEGLSDDEKKMFDDDSDGRALFLFHDFL
jgi:hypothetical protein